MIKRIVADVSPKGTKIALLEDLVLTEVYIENENHQTLVGNIYAGRVTNILPGIESAFVDIGTETNAFMYIGSKNENFDGENKIKIGLELAVQVIKDPQTSKGPVVSRDISIPGRLIALMPNQDYVGISHKITSESERERLNNIVLSNKPEGFGVIIRTCCQGASECEIVEEINSLKQTIDNIMSMAQYIKAPSPLHKELSPIEKAVRDLFSSDIDEFIINNRDAYIKVKSEAEKIFPNSLDKIMFYDDEIKLFDHYWINSQLKKAFEKKVWLKSGGYIVIEQTEACVVIDVNTGKNTCKKNSAKTILKINEEAAIEIARQIKLRNLSGIIIIDFISMKDDCDKKSIQDILISQTKKDRVKTVVVGMTELGLMQLTRKKAREPLSKFFDSIS